MILYISLVLTALLAALLVYRYDMYDRERWWMLLLAAALGAGVMGVIGYLIDFTLNLAGPGHRPAPFIAIVAATHEEGARLILVALIALVLRREFNDPMDGIIYGSIVGLGMAMEESLFYLGLWNTPPEQFLPPTEIVRLCGHLLLGGITGFAIGMARMKMRGWVRVLIGCVAVSVFLHFAWNWLAFAALAVGRMEAWQSILAAMIMLSGMLLYGVLVVVGSDWSRQIFDPHRKSELWGWPFSLLIQRRRDQPPA